MAVFILLRLSIGIFSVNWSNFSQPQMSPTLIQKKRKDHLSLQFFLSLSSFTSIWLILLNILEAASYFYILILSIAHFFIYIFKIDSLFFGVFFCFCLESISLCYSYRFANQNSCLCFVDRTAKVRMETNISIAFLNYVIWDKCCLCLFSIS